MQQNLTSKNEYTKSKNLLYLLIHIQAKVQQLRTFVGAMVLIVLCVFNRQQVQEETYNNYMKE